MPISVTNKISVHSKLNHIITVDQKIFPFQATATADQYL